MADEKRETSLPMPIKARPYYHQQAGFDFACRVFGLIDGKKRSCGVALLMEMGCGKTITSTSDRSDPDRLSAVNHRCLAGGVSEVCRFPLPADCSDRKLRKEETDASEYSQGRPADRGGQL